MASYATARPALDLYGERGGGRAAVGHGNGNGNADHSRVYDDADNDSADDDGGAAPQRSRSEPLTPLEASTSAGVHGRGLHSSTSQLNLSRF